MGDLYSIGEVSKITGISRDRLRYYEENAILVPVKKEANNYRIYQKKDIDMILAVEFFRSMDLTMQQIRSIWEDCNYRNIEKILEEKEKEVREKIKKQEAYLKRLQQGKESCQKIRKHLNRFSIRPMPPFHILGELKEFRAFKEYEKIHRVKGQDDAIVRMLKREIFFDGTGLTATRMLITNEIEQNREKEDIGLDIIQDIIIYDTCIYTVIEDNNSGVDIIDEVYEKSVKYINENQRNVMGKAYVNMLLIMADDTVTKTYLEIYIPIK